MKSLKSLAVAAALVFAVGVTDARADLITIDAGFINIGTTWAGDNSLDRANLFLTADAVVTFEMFAPSGDSGFVNTLVTPGGSITEPNAGSVNYEQAGGGYLNFSFSTPRSSLVPANSLVVVENGSNDGFWTAPVNIFGQPTLATSFFVQVITSNDFVFEAWIGLDDYGAGPDRDFNDLKAKLTVSKIVPDTHGVPDGGSALALLGIALTGLGVVRRRFS